jgi:hypothetical protein
VSVRNQKPDSSENHPSYEEAAHEGKKRISTRKVTNAKDYKMFLATLRPPFQIFFSNFSDPENTLCSFQ